MVVVFAHPYTRCVAHLHTEGTDGGPWRADLAILGGGDVVDVVVAVDDALQVEGIRDLAHQLAGALGDATRTRALDVLRIEQHN